MARDDSDRLIFMEKLDKATEIGGFEFGLLSSG